MVRVWNDKAETFWEKEPLSLSQNDFKCSAVPSLQTGLKLFLSQGSMIFYGLLFLILLLKFDFIYFFIFLRPTAQWSILFVNISGKILQSYLFYCQVPAIMAYFFVKKHPFSFHPFTHPMSPSHLCNPPTQAVWGEPLPSLMHPSGIRRD